MVRNTEILATAGSPRVGHAHNSVDDVADLFRSKHDLVIVNIGHEPFLVNLQAAKPPLSFS